MKYNLNIIETPEKVWDLLNAVQKETYIAFDTETTGVHKNAQIIGLSICFSELSAYYIILMKWTGKELHHVPGMEEPTKSLIKVLSTKSLIAHNSIFDCRVILDNYKINLIDSIHTDTVVAAHLLNENRRVGLKELSANLFGEDAKKEQQEMKESVQANGGTVTKTSYEMYKADSHILAKYGAKDALLTYKLFLEFVIELHSQNLCDFFYEEESMPLLKGPTYDLNTTGLQVDVKFLKNLKKELEAESLEDLEFINNEITPFIKEKYPGTNKKNKFNINSSQQLSWLLFGQLKLEFGTLTDAGKDVCKALSLKMPYFKSAKDDFIACVQLVQGTEYAPKKKVKEPWAYIACDKETLTKFSNRYKWIAKLLSYQRKKKLLSTYIDGMLERIQYGVIYPSFLQHGTTSGRYSSRDPNFQNLPRDDKRIKQAIVARPGKVFVGGDYSQLEPRVFAYFSNDERLLSAFKGSDDFYSVIGMEVFDKTDCTPQKEGSPDAFGIKYKSLRNLSKVIALASTYGSTAFQLKKTTGKSQEETQEVIDAYFQKFPNVAKMMLESHEMVKKDGQVTNLFGRPRRIPEAKLIGKAKHENLPYAQRTLLNLAVNHRIQSTGASIVNRGAIAFKKACKSAGIEASIVVQVHDSLIVECGEEVADKVAELLRQAMENTIDLKTIGLEFKPIIGKNLAEV